MSSKRALYKPVPSEKISQRRNRKPLAQGRLVNNAASKDQNREKNTIGREEDTKVTTPRARLHSRVINPVKAEDDRLTPRLPPHCKQQMSPRATGPAHSLDLSDSDQDSGKLPSARHLTHGAGAGNVLVIDASQQSFDPNRSEVDIVMGYARSPAKVICHSPAQKRGGNRSSRVLVDEVPSVNILTENTDHLAEKLNHSNPHYPSTVDHPRSYHSHVMDQPKALSRLASPPGSSTATLKPKSPLEVISPQKLPVPQLPSSPPHYPQPDFDDSLKSLSPGQGKREEDSDDQMSIVSTTSSLREVLGNSDIKSSAQIDKKKKVHVVSSRYMQSAKLKSGTPINHSKLNKSAPHNLRSSKGSSATKTSGRKKGKPFNQSMSVKIQQTPVVQQPKTSGKTSTPTHDEVSFIQNIDTSAIAPANMSTLATSVLSTTEVSYVDSHKKAEEEAGPGQLDLGIMYTQYLQWLYLDSAARKALHSQEKSAMGQLYGLWEEVERLREVDSDLQSQLLQLNHANRLDELLDLQRSGLGPVIANLSQLGKEHRVMAHALDTTRHQIATRGIHLPSDPDNFQNMLISALGESERLLGQLSVMTRPDSARLSEYSNAIAALEEAVDKESRALWECQELLAAAQSLTTAETSLRIQAIQTPEISPNTT